MEICLFLKIGYSCNSIFQRNKVGNGASVVTGSLLVPFCGNQCLWKHFQASSPVIVFFLSDPSWSSQETKAETVGASNCLCTWGEMPDG